MTTCRSLPDSTLMYRITLSDNPADALEGLAGMTALLTEATECLYGKHGGISDRAVFGWWCVLDITRRGLEEIIQVMDGQQTP